MGPNEPYWQTNTSFSPPLSSRWDQMFQSEGLSHSSHGGMQLYGSSLSSNSKESRSWVRSDQFPFHHYSASDGVVSHFSSPTDGAQTQQHTPLLQGANLDFVSTTVQEPASGSFLFTQSMEGPLGLRATAAPNSCSSTSLSDASECGHMAKSPSRFLHRNFTSHCSFMSKSVHPLSFPTEISEIESHISTADSRIKDRMVAASTLHSEPKSFRTLAEPHSLPGSSNVSAGFHPDGLLWSSSSSIDFTDISDQLDVECPGLSCNISDSLRCGICERLLSQRSPWSSVRIVRCGDMPVAGVLSCSHVYHAECLEHTTPKIHKHDPPCPLCAKSDEEIRPVPERQVLATRLKSGFPKLKSTVEDGGATSSKSWTCGQWGDCVEGTVQAPSGGNLSILNKRCLKKQSAKRGSSNKDLPESVMMRKRGLFSSKLFNGRTLHPLAASGCSRSTPSGHSLKRW